LLVFLFVNKYKTENNNNNKVKTNKQNKKTSNKTRIKIIIIFKNHPPENLCSAVNYQIFIPCNEDT